MSGIDVLLILACLLYAWASLLTAILVSTAAPKSITKLEFFFSCTFLGICWPIVLFFVASDIKNLGYPVRFRDD